MPTEYAVPADIEKEIIDTINAAAGVWGGPILDARRSSEAVTAARKAASKEVLEAIASNPEGGHYGALATLVDVAHNGFLPDCDGEIGIPVIIPFEGATPREGLPADPDEIDGYRGDIPGTPIYSGALDGQQLAHDQPNPVSGRMSPIACLYSIVNGRLKFTGKSAEVPLISITDEMIETKMPLGLAPAVTKRAIPKLVKEGDNLFIIAREFGADGKQDLIEIAGGAMKVRPVNQPNIVAAQKQAI